jgi:pilus assembly protein CpaB
MTLTDSRPAAKPNGSTVKAAPGRRRLRARLSKEQWIALVAGLVAVVAVYVALGDRRNTVEVAVAREGIPSATRLTSDMVRFVGLPADSPVVSDLVQADELAGREWVTTRAIARGEPLTTAAVVGDLPGDGLRSMSVPVAREHAVGGALRPGDRVDVIDVTEEGVDYVLQDIEVLTVGSESAGSLDAQPTEFAVTLAVGPNQAMGLAWAIADEQFEIVRSTGATPMNRDDDDEGGG